MTAGKQLEIIAKLVNKDRQGTEICSALSPFFLTSVYVLLVNNDMKVDNYGCWSIRAD